MILEIQSKMKAYTENEAKEVIENFRTKAKTDSFTLKKAGYEYKTKKTKGEIIGECWLVTITQVFNELWEDLE